jgi:catechol 2,3-dioxygenase-like lactoylglutathione lyase family enzyme
MFAGMAFIPNAEGHVAEGQGEGLQLYSYFYGTDLADGQIDGNIELNADFWARGYARQMTFVQNEDGVTTIPVSMFFVNSNNYLYIALSWDAGNSGGGNGVWMFFDEGNEAGVSNDGNHDDALTNPSGQRNEDAIFEDKNGVDNDLNWNNGAQAWQNDATGTNKVMAVNNFGSPATYFNAEFKIPLTRENDDATNSNLDITGGSEIGIYIVMFLTGGGPPPAGHYYWDATNVQPGNKNSGGAYEPLVSDNFNNQWGDLKLGVAREQTTLFSSVNINGDPTVDGNINDDQAWTNAYTRQMVFTNFQGATMDVKFYSVQNQVSNDVWCGFWVEDDDFHGADEFHIFQERETGASPDNTVNTRNYVLDDNYENQIYVNGAGAWEDWYYESPGGGTPGTWTIDLGDQSANAAVQYFSDPVPHYEFEFELPYQADTEDLDIADGGLFGFLMKFVDNDMPAGEQEFFWELTANDELIRIAEDYEDNVAVGWCDFQLGGPVVYPITPDEGGVVFGRDYKVRIYAKDEELTPPFGILSAAFKTDNMDSYKTLFQDPDEDGIWYTYWDTTGLPNGATTFTIWVLDNDGVAVLLKFDIIIANPGPAGDPPLLVDLTSTPPAPGPLSGTVNFIGTAVFVDYIEFYLDGVLFSVENIPIFDEFHASLDTTLFNDGGHIISIKAVNTAGETWDSAVYVFDNWNLNSLMITQPMFGAMVNQSITVTGDYEADGSGQLSELFVDGEFWDQSTTPVDLGGGDMAFQFNLDTTLLSEGSHEVQVFVYDPDGNVLSDKVIIVVDNNPPKTPGIAAPLDDQFVHGMFTFQVECAIDDIMAVDITVTNEDTTTTVIAGQILGYSSATGYYELTIDTRALMDGNYAVYAESMDYAGNTEVSSTMTFKIDNNAPTLSVSSPMDNAMVAGNVDIMSMAEDPFLMGHMYKIDGNSWVDINTTWDTTAYLDGAHMIHVMAADELGHKTMLTLNVVVDNTGPTVDIINPLSMEFVMGVYTFRVAATDMVGVDMVEISLGITGGTTMVMENQAIPLNSATGHYEYTLDTVSIDDGDYTFSAMSYDMYGQTMAADPVNFMIDNNAPNLVINSPLSGDLVDEGDITFDVTVTDTFTTDTWYRVDGGSWIAIATPWDTTAVMDGMHTIDFKVNDEAGHMTTRTIEVVTDNHGPSIHVVSMPAAGSFVGSEFMIQVEVVDVHEIGEVSYTFGTNESIRLFKNMQTGFYEATIVTGADGATNLVITAMDIGGRDSSYTRSITVDNSGPTIAKEKPTGVLKDDVKFVYAVTDDLSGVEKVYLRINKGPWVEMHTDAEGKYVYTWNSKTAANGKYDVDVLAEDALGNQATDAMVITVDNFPIWAFLIFLIVLIILLVLMILSWPRGGKKKKKSKAPKEEISIEPEEPEPEIQGSEEEEVLDLGEIEESPEPELRSSEEFMDNKEDNL